MSNQINVDITTCNITSVDITTINTQNNVDITTENWKS